MRKRGGFNNNNFGKIISGLIRMQFDTVSEKELVSELQKTR
ncbi:MAG: hypothetical protein ACOX2F_09875 [bacterium]